MAGDVDIPTPIPQVVFLITGRTWQTINKEIEDLNSTVQKLDFTDI